MKTYAITLRFQTKERSYVKAKEKAALLFDTVMVADPTVNGARHPYEVTEAVRS